MKYDSDFYRIRINRLANGYLTSWKQIKLLNYQKGKLLSQRMDVQIRKKLLIDWYI